jgi:ribosomal protein L11 methylase PrmA
LPAGQQWSFDLYSSLTFQEDFPHDQSFTRPRGSRFARERADRVCTGGAAGSADAPPMLQVANVTKNDIVYDLGCGDGRIPVTAARKYGARGVCIDIDPQRIKEANENVAKNNVGERVRVMNADLFATDLSEATVVTLYLLPSLNVKLMPKLMKELKPGTRIVSHAFDMGDWKPEKELDVNGRKVYYWTIPKR